jgi:hypothetical protein
MEVTPDGVIHQLYRPNNIPAGEKYKKMVEGWIKSNPKTKFEFKLAG